MRRLRAGNGGGIPAYAGTTIGYAKVSNGNEPARPQSPLP